MYLKEKGKRSSLFKNNEKEKAAENNRKLQNLKNVGVIFWEGKRENLFQSKLG